MKFFFLESKNVNASKSIIAEFKLHPVRLGFSASNAIEDMSRDEMEPDFSITMYLV